MYVKLPENDLRMPSLHNSLFMKTKGLTPSISEASARHALVRSYVPDFIYVEGWLKGQSYAVVL